MSTEFLLTDFNFPYTWLWCSGHLKIVFRGFLCFMRKKKLNIHHSTDVTHAFLFQYLMFSGYALNIAEEDELEGNLRQKDNEC